MSETCPYELCIGEAGFNIFSVIWNLKCFQVLDQYLPLALEYLAYTKSAAEC